MSPAISRSRFDYLKTNLSNMAEIILEQTLTLGDALEKDDYALAEKVIHFDDRIDDLEKENDNISQNAILEAVASRKAMGLDGYSGETVLKKDPLRFALSAIRITRNLERIGDNIVNAARVFKNGQVARGIFERDELFSLMLQRVITIIGMAVESLVEEKNRFFGSIQQVDAELDRLCQRAFEAAVADDKMERMAFADLYRIILSLERMGDLAVNIGEELVRLQTGQDIRHLDNLQRPPAPHPSAN
ncbi:MAG: phosphate uptake regulator PhoU [Leptospirales bacterium]|nr:phosphate uptake regulator PhoU [Leptospirales bacterium]